MGTFATKLFSITYEAAAVEKSRLEGNHGHNETVQREEGGEQE